MAGNVENMTIADFKAGGRLGLRAGDVSAFGPGSVRVVTLPKGFRLFKLSSGSAPEGKYGVTPWWSPVKPYMEDDEGALGRFEQAKANKIDMSAMVRYMSAVCIDWNTLDNYIEVQAETELAAFWGTFAPQKKFNDEANRSQVKETWTSRGSAHAEPAVLPEDLGVLPAWQFFIPKLTDAHIKRNSLIDAHNMVALAMHLGGR